MISCKFHIFYPIQSICEENSLQKCWIEKGIQASDNKSTFDLLKFFHDEENSEYILQSAKDFELHKRLMFIFRDYERVIKISTIISALVDKQQNFASDYFESNMLDMITESNSEMNSLYNCLSEEIIK